MSVPMREELHGPSVSVAALFKAVRSEPEGGLTLVQLLEAVRIPPASSASKRRPSQSFTRAICATSSWNFAGT
jgi:hypothetical protein